MSEDSMEECFLCRKNEKLDQKIHQKAVQNAHVLSVQEADKLLKKGLPNVSWESVQAMQYPQIQKHELERWKVFLTEMEQDRLIREAFKTKDWNTCGYHSENMGWFGTEFHDEVLKDVQRKFAKSKWPKKCYF